MSIAASIASFASHSTHEVFIGGRRVEAVSAATEHGYDMASASGEVVLVDLPTWVEFRMTLEIRMGWDGRTQTTFRGFVEDITPGFDAGGETTIVKGAGYLKLTQFAYWDEIAYAGDTDEDIVSNLLDLSGVPNASVSGASEVLGAVQDVVLAAGQAPRDLINRIDQTLGYKTWDAPDGTVRRRAISGNPSGGAARTFTEGTDIFSITRPRTIRNVQNHVTVTGLPQAAFTPFSERFAESPFVPNPPGYVTHEFQSDLIEDNTLAEATSLRLMRETNRIVEEIELTTKGDPRRQPGETIGVTSGRLGISGTMRCWCRRVSQRSDAGGFMTTLALEGGQGAAGEELDIPPEAVFTYILTRETYLVTGTPTNMYTVTCDGSGSYDPDGTVTIWAWANNKNADTGSALTYATAFTQAEIDAAASITLTVTDNDGNTGTITQVLVPSGPNVLVRDLYIAEGSRAAATPDGGATWNTWTPGAGTVVSTPTIAGNDHSYFGLSDGKLYRTDDYLATAPTEVEDFGSQVNCIWIHEQNADRVTVGLQNGQVWNTTNASALGASTWNLLRDYADAVLDVVESGFTAGEYRVTTGNELRITVNEFATEAVLIDFGGTARQIIPSIVGLPGKATASATGPVRSEDGTTYTYATSAPTDVRAGTHHIRAAILYVIDRAGEVWATADAGTEFTNIGQLGAGDPANRLIRDGDNQLVLYAAADDGAWKTFDGGVTWKQLRDLSAGGLSGNQIGYGSLTALALTPVTLYSLAANEKAWATDTDGAEPAGWQELAFDDSSWAASVTHIDGGMPAAIDSPSSEYVGRTTGDHGDADVLLLRREFALSTGVVSAAALIIAADNIKRGVWINNVLVFSSTENISQETVTLDPTVFLPGQTNVLGIRVQNIPGVGDNYLRANYKLSVT